MVQAFWRQGFCSAQVELVEMIDRPLGFQAGERRCSETHQDDRHSGRLRGLHVDVAVAHQKGAGWVSARELDRAV